MKNYGFSGPFFGDPTASHSDCILGTKTSPSPHGCLVHPPTCYELNFLFWERSGFCFFPCPPDHQNSLPLQRLYDSNNCENEIYSPGSDLSLCQPPIHGSPVKGSFRSPKQRAAWIFFFFPEPMTHTVGRGTPVGSPSPCLDDEDAAWVWGTEALGKGAVTRLRWR